MAIIYCLTDGEGTKRFDSSNERQTAWSAAYLRGEVTCEWLELTGEDRRKVEVINSFGHIVPWLYDNRHGIQAQIREDVPTAVAYRFLDYAPGEWLVMSD